MSQKIILDCDTGVDDTLAISYAVLHPEVDLVGVGSVWGNVDVPTATRNCLHTVTMLGRPDIPVAHGAAGPITGDPPKFAYHVHGDDGQGNAARPADLPPPVDISAAEQIIALAKAQPGEIEIVAVGPMTNIAIALGLCQELPDLVQGITIMGGAALAPGNVTPAAEANIECDPEAAAAVFNAPWRVRMVGLDVTMRTTMDESHRARLAAGGEVGKYFSEILDFYFGYFADAAFGDRRCCMHDALAVGLAAGTLTTHLMPRVNAEVVLSGASRGQTLCDLRGMYMGFPEQEGAHCDVLLDCDTGFVDEVIDLIAGCGDGIWGEAS